MDLFGLVHIFMVSHQPPRLVLPFEERCCRDSNAGRNGKIEIGECCRMSKTLIVSCELNVDHKAMLMLLPAVPDRVSLVPCFASLLHSWPNACESWIHPRGRKCRRQGPLPPMATLRGLPLTYNAWYPPVWPLGCSLGGVSSQRVTRNSSNSCGRLMALPVSAIIYMWW